MPVKLLTNRPHIAGMKPPAKQRVGNTEIDVCYLFSEISDLPECEAGAGSMGKSVVRIGIAGCGTAARIHLDRLLTLDEVTIVGCADTDLDAATALAARASAALGPNEVNEPVLAFADHLI